MNSMNNYMHALSKAKRSVNTGMLAGNGTIRAAVKGYASGKLSDEEVHQVWKTLEEALSAGSLGVSLGVAYAPEFEYDRDGLAQVLQPLKDTDIPITTHIRNEGDGILPALREVISVSGGTAYSAACQPYEMYWSEKLGRYSSKNSAIIR